MPQVQWKLYVNDDLGQSTIYMEIGLDEGQLAELWYLIKAGNCPSDIAMQLVYLADLFGHSYRPGETLGCTNRHTVRLTLEVPDEN